MERATVIAGHWTLDLGHWTFDFLGHLESDECAV